ncbi:MULTISPECIES: 2-amino-4-hydroxy-6-hydroxymethyldihydropteridine diphosphokinase [unclassified Agrococcus]|uniref:2-amino-4-hydroxy-6- hydroxymethyldihydropteridine diphosphokinase n=1 Tax=unclassified Agrococcus TaxID=2615065 RepID=UPI00361A7857
MMLREAEAVLSIGANLGDRAALVRQAIDLLDRAPGMRVTARSGLWESPAWHPDGATDAPDYVNAVAIVRTTLEPLDLLDAVHAIEDALGRVRAQRYGDRTIDVDVVAIGGTVSDDARLTLPHPRAHERQFVLQPWLEVQPSAELPGHGGIAELAEYAHGDVWPYRGGGG